MKKHTVLILAVLTAAIAVFVLPFIYSIYKALERM